MKYIQLLTKFLKDIHLSKQLLFDLVKNDLKSKYVKNYLGGLWAFLQPTVLIIIFWFVFEVGFKSKPVDNFPFILWLMTGIIPWFFFAESLQSSTQSILANSFLVKKIVFKISLLPVIKIISALTIHIFFILFLFGMFIYYGYMPTIYWLQIFYYLICTIILLLGLSWLTSSIVVFFRDLENIVTMLIQFGFWLTPIFWSIKILPFEYQNIIQYNPIYYIIEGYRDSLIYNVWFWEKPELGLWYWSVTMIFFFVGLTVFRRLKIHFADVL